MSVKTSPEAIAAAARAARDGTGLPPVHLWNPAFCGDLDMEIRRDGTWFYEGTPITRPGLVKLFSSILRKEGADYFLVTPVEKVGIRVEDAPFVAVDAEVSGTGEDQSLTLTTHVGDVVRIGPDAPLRVVHDPETGEPAPYVLVRAELEALIDRKTFYRLVDLGTCAEVGGERWFGLWSGGVFFPVILASELP
ncbi:MAG: DUF1285 domain-containing protein [Pseudomonadota bacterium]